MWWPVGRRRRRPPAAEAGAADEPAADGAGRQPDVAAAAAGDELDAAADGVFLLLEHPAISVASTATGATTAVRRCRRPPVGKLELMDSPPAIGDPIGVAR